MGGSTVWVFGGLGLDSEENREHCHISNVY